MYTFNLSTFDKQSKLKQKLKEKEQRKGILGKVDGAAVKAPDKPDENKPDDPKPDEHKNSEPKSSTDDKLDQPKALVNSKSQRNFS